MLSSDRSERVTGEPSGAPETLAGRIQPGAFGDRVHRSICVHHLQPRAALGLVLDALDLRGMAGVWVCEWLCVWLLLLVVWAVRRIPDRGPALVRRCRASDRGTQQWS